MSEPTAKRAPLALMIDMMLTRTRQRVGTPVLCALLLTTAGCSMMPTYQQPEAALDVQLMQSSGWHLASPVDDKAVRDKAAARSTNAAVKTSAAQTDTDSEGNGAGPARGKSDTEGYGVVGLIDATPFNDPQLTALLAQVRSDNLDIRQAEARLRSAQAVLAGAGASRVPQVTANVGGQRGKAGSSTMGGSSSSMGTGTATGTDASQLAAASGGDSVANQFEGSASISWTPDLWGKVSSQVESSKASLESAEADRQAAVLAAQVNLMQAYVRMRLAEERLVLLAKSIETVERSLALTKNQHQAGLVARADVIQAETTLQSVVTQRHALERSRDTERHAIAVLLGIAPSALPAFEARAMPTLPALPEQMSIDLLRRRPDIRSAERLVASANAQIGVARGAWLPDLTFSGTYGLGSETFANLISSPLRTWSLGTQLAATLFDGGTRRSTLNQNLAAYDLQVATYRQQVLTAVKEIEDGLLAQRVLANQAKDQAQLVDLAAEAERVVRDRYRGGLVNYLELASAERESLTAQDTALSLQGERLNEYVTLLAALGGSW